MRFTTRTMLSPATRNGPLKFIAALGMLVTAANPASASPLLINGGFEAGNFSGWTVSAFTGQSLGLDDTKHTTANFLVNEGNGTPAAATNGVVASQTTSFDGSGPAASSAVLPTEGNQLAFIANETSTGEVTGESAIVGSAIRQSFMVAPGASSLTFDLQFLSNEEIDGGFDFGGVALLDSLNNVLAEFILDNDPTTPTSVAHAHTSAVAAGGFNDSAGWLSEAFDLTGHNGQTLTLLAFSTHTFDALTESRTLLDNVIEVAPTTVPVPSALTLLGLGLLGVWNLQVKFRREG